jgi:quinol monooxygenase YgiN
MLMNPKNKNELLNAVRNISEEVRKEKGCIDNLIFRSLDDENELIMMESWKSKSYLKKHWKTINFSALLGVQNLLSRPLNVEINNVSGTQGLAEIEKIRADKKAKNYEKGLKIYDNLNSLSEKH